MKILVTGAAGFIGSTLVDALRREHEVRAIDNFSIGTVRQVGDVQVEQMDVAVPADAERMVEGMDVVVHLAGMTGIPSCENQPEAASRNILVATKYVADAAVRAGVKHFLFASTFAVYGATSRCVTEDTPMAPIGMYGILRAASEYHLRSAMLLEGLNVLIFRQTNIYGVGLTKKRTLLNLLTDRVLARQPMTIFGTGTQVRNFLHVLDTVTAYKLAIEKGAAGVFNLGSDEVMSVQAVVDTVNEAAERILGYTVPVEILPDRGAGNREIQVTELELDISRVKQALEFEPRYTIRSTVENLLLEGRQGAAP